MQLEIYSRPRTTTNSQRPLLASDLIYTLYQGHTIQLRCMGIGESRSYVAPMKASFRIFVYGGHGVKVASSTLWSFDLREYTWHSIPMQSAKTEAPASDPGCRFGLTSCVHGGSMYFFGGQQNGKLVNSTLWSLDLERLCWHQIQAAGVPPTPRT